MPTRSAVLYGRVSKLSAAERRKLGAAEAKSVDQQLDLLRARAEREAVTVVAEFRDDGISASRYGGGKAREGWQATMEAVSSGQVTELWVWEISRATRDRPVWAGLLSACMLHRVAIVIDGKTHDPNDPDDSFILDLLAALAIRESAVISKRIRRDVAAAALKGKVHGKIAYGYRRVYDPLTRELLRQEPDPEHAPIVAEVIERVADGETSYSICRDLIARGVPSPHQARATRQGVELVDPYPWTPEQVNRLAAKPTYAGLRTHDPVGEPRTLAPRVVADGDWTPIVPRELHERALLALARNPGRGQPRDSSARHLLTGIATCGVCGAIVRLISNRGYPSYSCWGTPKNRGGFCVTRRQDPVDVYVTASVLKRLARPDAALLFEAEDQQPDIEQARLELARLQERLDEYYRMANDPARILAGTALSAEALAQQEITLRPMIDAARARTVPRTTPALVKAGIEAPDKRVWWFGDPADPDDFGLSIADRRSVVRDLVAVRILKSPYKNGVRGFDPTLISIRWADGRNEDPAED